MTTENFSLSVIHNIVSLYGIFRNTNVKDYAPIDTAIQKAVSFCKIEKEDLVIVIKGVEYANDVFTDFFTSYLRELSNKEKIHIVMLFANCDFWQRKVASALKTLAPKIQSYDDCKKTPYIPYLEQDC